VFNAVNPKDCWNNNMNKSISLGANALLKAIHSIAEEQSEKSKMSRDKKLNYSLSTFDKAITTKESRLSDKEPKIYKKSLENYYYIKNLHLNQKLPHKSTHKVSLKHWESDLIKKEYADLLPKIHSNKRKDKKQKYTYAI